MGRLIDADKLWVEIIRRMDYCEDILEIIKKQPTVERKKGKWVADEKRFGDDGYHCDQCGAILEGDALIWRNNYYCYHCGADMRKDGES